MSSQHRIYRYMSEPLKFVGLSMDELTVAMLGFIGNFVFDSLSLRLISLVVAVFGVILLKKAKKQRVGVNLMSFLYWHGFNFRTSSQFPAFEHMLYLS